MAVPSNKATWLTHPNTPKPLNVDTAPYTHPQAQELVVKVRAVAINPIDWLKANKGFGFVFKWIKLPFIQGTDLASDVVETGPGGAFQYHTACVERMTSPLTDHLTYEAACVIPLGATTAACAMFQADQLNLLRPAFPRSETGKTILIWGGSTSVGCNAIQLAAAAGYDIVTTCSPKNSQICETLGASQCVDYNAKTVVKDLIGALKDTDFAGAISVGINSDGPCFEIVSHCKPGRFVSMVSFPRQEPEPTSLILPRTIALYTSWFISTIIKTKTRGIGWKLVSVHAMSQNGLGEAMYADYLPSALADGSFVAAPEPEVVGSGLEAIQEAFVRQEKGMSAKKAVVSVQSSDQGIV